MFVVDYKHELFDHRRLLILIKNIDPICDSKLFDEVYESACIYHGFLFPKLPVLHSFLSRASRLQQDALVDTQSEVCGSTVLEEHPIWIRYTRQFHSANNAWSSFQAHRLVLGVIGLSLCKTTEDVEQAIENYTKQKALVSENCTSGRLIILVPTRSDPASLTVTKASEWIAEQMKELPRSLLLAADEILAHPAEQVFNTDIMGMTDLSPDSGVGSMWSRKPASNVTPSQPPILNSRIVGALTDLVSGICYGLEKSVSLLEAKKSGKSNLLNAASSSAGTSDLSDGEGSESNFKVLLAPGEATPSRLSDDSSTTDEQRGNSKQFGSYTPTDPTTGPSNQSDASFNFLNVVKHRRSSGRWKKHLGDVCLQLGELDKAQQYYDSTVQLLRPIMDNLWVAGALEGLCAIAVARKLLRLQSSDPYIRARRPLRAATPRYASNERALSIASDTSSLDLASQKQKPSTQFTALDYRNMAVEALELYRKSQVDRYMLEETSYKIARFFIFENHKLKACELLDHLFSVALQDESDENALKPKRLKTLIELYRSMGYNRRAGFVAWHVLDENLKPYKEPPDSDSLFQSFRLQLFPAYFGNESVIDSPDLLQSNESTALSQPSSPNAGSILRRPAFPVAVYPVMLKQILAWHTDLATGHGSSKFGRLNNKSAFMAGSSNRIGAQFHSSKRLTHNAQQPGGQRLSKTDHVQYLPIGWSALQATVLNRLLDRIKLDSQFEDIAELPWEKALKFIGFIFSLVDTWPHKMDESKCVTCMDDLCRLAVMRCPDQPAIASSMPSFAPYASGNADRRQFGRQTGILSGSAQNPLLYDRQKSTESTQLRQLVDLIEVPVYQLPLIQSIQLLPLVPHSLPCELSKEGLTSAVPLHRTSRLSVGAPASDITEHTIIATTQDNPQSGPFFYTPLGHDSLPDSGIASIDWVCEEPVCVELLLRNPLPVDLRISDVCIELTPLTNTTIANRPSSVFSSSEYESALNVLNQTTVQLEAIRLVMELPSGFSMRNSADRSGYRKRNVAVKTTTQGSFSVPLNEACLLETAEDRMRYQQSPFQSAWRRKDHSLSCTIPANRCGIRLVFTFIPMAELYAFASGMDEPNAKPMFRLTALTYRLVDFGGMHVCLRPSVNETETSCEPMVTHSQEFPNSIRERRLSNSSSSAASGISLLRSSLTSGFESILPNPTAPAAISAFDSAAVRIGHHPNLVLASRLFTTLPTIRLRPPMPRLFIFPGVVRSAFTFREATQFLPELTIPSLRKNAQNLDFREPHQVQPPRFRTPQSSHWSSRVASVVEVSLYPFESRWMPLELFVRDQGYLPPLANSASLRYLNVMRASFRPTENAQDLLKKLHLTTDDLVECTGMDDIHKKLPLDIRNEKITDLRLQTTQDGSEVRMEPFCATECGLIWIGFRSGRFWSRLAHLLTTSEGKNILGPGLNLQNSKKLMIEFEIEYALNAPTGMAAEAVSLSNPFWARRVRLGLQLNLLASKHAPLVLHQPRILFHDEPFGDNDDDESENDSDVDDEDDTDRLLGDVKSKTFFYSTFRARMPQSLVPRPVRFIGPQYRVELELRVKWSNYVNRTYREPIKLTTPWTMLTENTPRARDASVSITPTASPGFFRSESVMSSSSVITDALNSVEEVFEPDKENLRVYHHLTLPMNGLSDVVLRPTPIQVLDPTHLRTDEIGLPIPTNIDWLVDTIESNIEIIWKSHMHARWPQNEIRGFTTSDSRSGIPFPDPRFYRFGRFILSAHTPEPIPIDKSITATDGTTAKSPLTATPFTSPKSWYGDSFSTNGSLAGLLWCHNIRLEVSLSEFLTSKMKPNPLLSPGKPPPQGRLCVRCRDEGTILFHRKSIFGRRASQPLTSLSSTSSSSPSKGPRLRTLTENIPQSDFDPDKQQRRASVPELASPQSLHTLDGEVLQNAQRMCTLVMEPVSVVIKGWVHNHPLEGVRIHGSADITATGKPYSAPPTVDIHRIWTGPVVYEIITKRPLDEPFNDVASLEIRGPLLQGKEFEFIGRAGGEMGLTLSNRLKVNQMQSHVSSIVFFRPGRFWICGLMGIVPESLQLPSVKATDLAVFTLPSVANVETIRFSPNGITIHVLDTTTMPTDGSGSLVR